MNKKKRKSVSLTILGGVKHTVIGGDKGSNPLPTAIIYFIKIK